MHFSTILASLGLLARLVSAAPLKVLPREATGAQNVVYWGQNGGGTIENNDLSAYCTSTSGIDIIVISFLYEFGNGNNIASGTIGQSCFITSAGVGQQCDALTSAIQTCQKNGVKIIISLGGASSSWSLTSQAEAETIGQNLWEAYGNVAANGSVPRPFNSTFVNGWDFDLEANSGNEYFQYMIAKLRSNFASDSANTYYITGAPQCPIPEPNMGVVIGNSTFDYLFVQFYNNNDYAPDPCSLGFNGNAPFNYNDWVTFITGTPSADAKVFIGVPAAPLAANGSPSGDIYYATPAQLAGLVADYKSNSHFGGIMMWSAGFSDTNVNNGCTFAQDMHSVLSTGSPCGGGGGSNTTTTVTSQTSSTRSTSSTLTTRSATLTTTSSTLTTTSSAATGTPVQEWGQCGGSGYTGSTVCATPYSCVATSTSWSQCQ
ncbi:Endochitinase [Lachnellula occidentalis]|uniref:Endochitinase n=1 Tax=Lachnellula occidentalis TaxID=215460 RepID=A0A8H8RKT8_9HELO|nr:Endochitinase [Lachnellula occidentalis]